MGEREREGLCDGVIEGFGDESSLPLALYFTSIYDHSVFEAFSKVLCESECVRE